MESLQVCDYMNIHPVKISEDLCVAEAVELLLLSGQTGGVVLDRQNHTVIGFLSEQDCLSHMVQSSYYREQVCRVRDIMQTPVVSVRPHTSILEVAQKLLTEKPRLFPVIDDDGELVGAINRTAILKALDFNLGSGYQKVG